MAQEENIKNDDSSFDSAQDELKALQLKSEEYLNGWKRERADFLNYKKDEMERIGQLIKYANEELILKIIPILDNMMLAEAHLKDEGVAQIIKQIEDFLKKEGIEPIETLGKQFDPNIMESIEGDGSTVSEEVQRGYTMHGKIIRVARVKISE
jgi:molecular chaperone GrpE